MPGTVLGPENAGLDKTDIVPALLGTLKISYLKVLTLLNAHSVPNHLSTFQDYLITLVYLRLVRITFPACLNLMLFRYTILFTSRVFWIIFLGYRRSPSIIYLLPFPI